MPTHVALLRGINLGPHKRVAMPALRALVESLGHTEVATYIASGNVVFTAGDDAAPGPGLEKAIAAELGVECRVVVLTCAELARAVADNPYPDEPDPKRVHAIFLTGASGPRGAGAPRAGPGASSGAKVGRDEAEIVGRTLYLHTPDGFGRSELAKVLSRPGGPAEGTARNWATVTKLLAMCDG